VKASCCEELFKQEAMSVVRLLYRREKLKKTPKGVETSYLEHEGLRPLTLSPYLFHSTECYKRITAPSLYTTGNLKYKCNIAVRYGNFSDTTVQRVIATRVDRRLTSADEFLDELPGKVGKEKR